ncbi:MAG: hypothetical protein IT372_34440 [Polyangiaceae bacterium]|nr:hypothetical protein [Polyangiaceae bacterium]
MVPRLPAALLLAASLAAAACGGASPSQPPGKPPTPRSVTRANPGGDAADPEQAALQRLLDEPWGRRRDRFGTLSVPLADWKKWRRVRIWTQPTRATYRYGDNHYAVATVLYTPIKGRNDPDTCLADFWQKAAPQADAYGVRLGDAQLLRTIQDVDGETRPLVLKILDGSVDSVLASDDYVGAVAVYQSWPETCLVHAFAVKSTEHRDLALKIRDRWIKEGAPKLRWLPKVTAAPPTTAR